MPNEPHIARRAITERPLTKLSEDELTALDELSHHGALFAEGIESQLSVLGELAEHELAARELAGAREQWSK